jgi:hypothetical protein
MGGGSYGYGLYGYGSSITPKDVWAGSSPERAFSEETPWSFKRQAQVKFYRMLEQSRRALSLSTGSERIRIGQWKVDPQISAFYTSFPWPARASIGHTVFLEAVSTRDELVKSIRLYLNNPVILEGRNVNEAAYHLSADAIARSLANRALFDMLSEVQELGDVEFYRFFQVAQNSLKFRQLSDVIDGVVLLGDLLPSTQLLNLHPMTAQIMHALVRASRWFWRNSIANGEDSSIFVYKSWGVALMEALIPFLPSPAKPAPENQGRTKQRKSGSEHDHQNPQYRYPAENELEEITPEVIQPLLDP